MARKKDEEQQQELTLDDANSNIGHNSANAENISAETIRELEHAVDEAVAHCTHAEIASANMRETANADGIVAFYSLLSAVIQTEGLPAYYARRGIEIHGNTKNPFSPAVADRFRHVDTNFTRQMVWRWAAVIGVAVHENISVHALRDWLDAHGLDKIADDYKRIRIGEQPAHKVPDETLAERICVKKARPPKFLPRRFTLIVRAAPLSS